jgi:hypothetical protein
MRTKLFSFCNSLGGFIIIALEYYETGLPALGELGKDLRLRLILYTLFATIIFFQFSTVLGFQFLMSTNISLFLAIVNNEIPGVLK